VARKDVQQTPGLQAPDENLKRVQGTCEEDLLAWRKEIERSVSDVEARDDAARGRDGRTVRLFVARDKKREKGRKKKRSSSRRELASSASEIRLKKLVC
jgi:hypothetical protein